MRYETWETRGRRPVRYAPQLRAYAGAKADCRTAHDDIDGCCIVRCRVPGVKRPCAVLLDVDWSPLRGDPQIDREPEVRGFSIETQKKIKKLAQRRRDRRALRRSLVQECLHFHNEADFADFCQLYG